MSVSFPRVAIVAIGRNEGERLKACLTSVPSVALVVYVDSNSTDGSVQFAESLGIEIVRLDMSIPFSAARARNAGFNHVVSHAPGVEFVQFIDGDCQLVDGWIERAIVELDSNPKVAVVCGRRRERYPNGSIYNRLCDIEWDTPVGDAMACGGDAMIRASVLRAVGGFNDAVIAGEEPELCLRMRRLGWIIRRLDAEMTLHDAAMTTFWQWFRRMERAGHAYAQGARMHGNSQERHWVRETGSIVLWGSIIPSTILILLALTGPFAAAFVVLYLILALRSRKSYLRQGQSKTNATAAAIFNIIAKFPQMIGVSKYHLNRVFARETPLIEYKRVAT